MNNSEQSTKSLRGEAMSVYLRLKEIYPVIWQTLVDYYRNQYNASCEYRAKAKAKAKAMYDAKVIFTRQSEVNPMFYILNITPPAPYRVVIHTKKHRHQKNFADYDAAKRYRDEYIRANNITGLTFPNGENSYIRTNFLGKPYKVRIPVIMPDGTHNYWYQTADTAESAVEIRNDFLKKHKVVFKNSKRNITHLSYSSFNLSRGHIDISSLCTESI